MTVSLRRRGSWLAIAILAACARPPTVLQGEFASVAVDEARNDPRAVALRFSSYGDVKAACAQSVIEALGPIQARFADLMADPAELQRLLRSGAARARHQADPVLARARTAIGLCPP